MSYKFYVCEFRNRLYPTPEGFTFLKFGITHHTDVMKRFDPRVNDGYEKHYEDWDIRCKFSVSLPTQRWAEYVESQWLNKIYPLSSPAKVWIEKILDVPVKTKYSNNSGITEMRMVPLHIASKIYTLLHEHKRIYMEKYS